MNVSPPPQRLVIDQIRFLELADLVFAAVLCDQRMSAGSTGSYLDATGQKILLQATNKEPAPSRWYEVDVIVQS